MDQEFWEAISQGAFSTEKVLQKSKLRSLKQFGVEYNRFLQKFVEREKVRDRDGKESLFEDVQLAILQATLNEGRFKVAQANMLAKQSCEAKVA